MLSFHVKFVVTDRRTDGRTDRGTMVKQYAPDLSIQGYKNKLFIIAHENEQIQETNHRHPNRPDRILLDRIVGEEAP